MATEAQIKTLGSPVKFHFSGLTAPNRFAKSAMTERLCHATNGKPSEAYLEIYREWGRGQTGTIILGNIPVDVRSKEAVGNFCLDRGNDRWDAVTETEKVVKVTKAYGSLCIGQLTHGGRQTPKHINPEPVSSSETQCPPAMGNDYGVARAMTEEEILDLIDRFAWAAEVLYKSGADGAQLHAAHGYLLSQFLSPRINKRTDRWGGPLENRSRILFEAAKAIRKRVPDEKFMLAIKINSADFADGGFTAEESKITVQKLEEYGFDLIELSGGTYESRGFEHKKESTIAREAYFVEFASQFKVALNKATLLVTGGFRSAKAMAQAIDEGSTDMVGLARPLCAEPDLPKLILSGKSTGARENKVDASKQTPTAILQIHAMGEDRPIYDLSKQDTVDQLMKILDKKEAPPHPDGVDYPPM
ncbi:uncharacterized protein L969DRAFT_46004 [Mixia osmundae IAM 14324]|uniref:NADH:flavin oxidoreductase/NADH oxidase N-terminal domain-containing protein n=1 Tax=Mixia osmundae (strain CBS 9802 / IAM 14324 / JCM 22182 / KY 12970) TaxID=764103 RepID=G7E5B2_MIXOS|nr:uncharacterized protein L969DRAFT_46004 [Mixia osmundae IAM 14324]KEI40828.1 hypothetical protein L969DRAFT_46004 [Mixia osmundae IAM 14324]GAA98022.1 hypothetical protein E5Q_04702 [Mixia osmundae IAM 14324]